MIGVLGPDSALEGYTGPWTTWANEMNFDINHANFDSDPDYGIKMVKKCI